MTLTNVEPIRILLVEDSPGDISLTIEALRGARVANELSVVRDGEAAIAFLRGDPPYDGAARPNMVLLDLNLPLKDGREVLAEMKDDERLRSIPVVILTTSADNGDVADAYRNQAAGFVTKPVDFDDFLSTVRSIESFWLSIVRFPIP
jgi:chemotaxis family two-component system response regulator Rcp1